MLRMLAFEHTYHPAHHRLDHHDLVAGGDEVGIVAQGGDRRVDEGFKLHVGRDDAPRPNDGNWFAYHRRWRRYDGRRGDHHRCWCRPPTDHVLANEHFFVRSDIHVARRTHFSTWAAAP